MNKGKAIISAGRQISAVAAARLRNGSKTPEDVLNDPAAVRQDELGRHAGEDSGLDPEPSPDEPS